MKTQRVLVIANSEQHDALAAAILQEAPEQLVHTLVLGPSKPREAHAARFPLLVQCVALAKLLLVLPRDLVVKCRDVRWDPRAFPDYSVSTEHTTAVYIIVPFGVLPNERAFGEQGSPSTPNERHRLLALPTNSLLEIDPTLGRGGGREQVGCTSRRSSPVNFVRRLRQWGRGHIGSCAGKRIPGANSRHPRS